MIYSTPFGERRIRVFNHSIPVTANLSNYYKAADSETLAHFIVKRDLSKLMAKGTKVVREAFINNLVQLLHHYRQ